MLKKVYKLAQKESKPDDDKEVFYGITKKELDFNWNEDVEIEVRVSEPRSMARLTKFTSAGHDYFVETRPYKRVPASDGGRRRRGGWKLLQFLHSRR